MIYLTELQKQKLSDISLPRRLIRISDFIIFGKILKKFIMKFSHMFLSLTILMENINLRILSLNVGIKNSSFEKITNPLVSNGRRFWISFTTKFWQKCELRRIRLS